jgi:hypothetical protein
MVSAIADGLIYSIISAVEGGAEEQADSITVIAVTKIVKILAILVIVICLYFWSGY